MAHGIDRQLDRWLADVHALEQQALFHLRHAPRLAGDPELAGHLRRHRSDTGRHRSLVRERLAARGARPSTALDLAVTANRLGFLLYTASQPDAPGKLLVDSFAYEHLEVAAYAVLARAADVAGDPATARTARRIQADERAMAGILAGHAERVLAASERRGTGAARERIVAHLRDAHALESESAGLLALGARVAGAPALAAAYRDHLSQTRAHRRAVAGRLAALGERPSAVKSAGMGLAGVGWGLLWSVQRDTPTKLACFVYAAEHLEIAAYELLAGQARHAGDAETEQLAAGILAEERAQAARLAGLLDSAADAALRPRQPPGGPRRVPQQAPATS